MIRDAIKQRMKLLGIPSAYALTKLIDHCITQQAISNYLAGRTEMTSANVDLILAALGAEEIRFKK